MLIYNHIWPWEKSTLKKIIHRILQNYFMSRGYKRFVNSVAQFSKLLADHAERFRNNSKKLSFLK